MFSFLFLLFELDKLLLLQLLSSSSSFIFLNFAEEQHFVTDRDDSIYHHKEKKERKNELDHRQRDRQIDSGGNQRVKTRPNKLFFLLFRFHSPRSSSHSSCLFSLPRNCWQRLLSLFSSFFSWRSDWMSYFLVLLLLQSLHRYTY